MARTVRILSAEDMFQFQARPRGICGGTCGNRTTFPPAYRLSSVSIIRKITHIHICIVHSAQYDILKLLATPANAQLYNL